MARSFKTYTRRGFFISRTGGADAPWIARHDNGTKYRADTLAGIFALVRDHGEAE